MLENFASDHFDNSILLHQKMNKGKTLLYVPIILLGK